MPAPTTTYFALSVVEAPVTTFYAPSVPLTSYYAAPWPTTSYYYAQAVAAPVYGRLCDLVDDDRTRPHAVPRAVHLAQARDGPRPLAKEVDHHGRIEQDIH